MRGKITYSEKLRDPKWQKKRLEVFERDLFTCQLCGDKETELQVHHRTYVPGKEPWDYDNSNFITYCKCCHAVVEDLKSRSSGIPINVKKRYYPKKGNYTLLILTDCPVEKLRIGFYAYDSEGLMYFLSIGENNVADINCLRDRYINNLGK